MIEQNGSGLRVSGSMLIADAPALLTAGRGFLRTLPTDENEVVFDLPLRIFNTFFKPIRMLLGKNCTLL